VTRGQRTLAAIMVTDAVGFSARMSVDEERTLTLIHRDQQCMQQLCQQYEGRVLKSTGDGLLMYFASAVQAVSCGLQIQRELVAINQEAETHQALSHRIGIHLGDVFFSESDVMGNGVNIAARLQTEAHSGGICISQVVYDVVKSRLSLNATYAGPLQLKNIQAPVPAYHIDTVQPPFPASTTSPPDPKPQLAAHEKLPPGHKIGGRYVIKRVLGQGGFGRSYLVEDTQRFGEACVLKEFFPANRSSRSLQKAIDLFKREAKTLYQLKHPQVPKFLACFTQSQRLFMVQEYIPGVTYSDLLRQRKRQEQTFTETEVTNWLLKMLNVLAYLHNLKVVHRDISPDNIMYCEERNLPVLIDFGLVNDAISDLLSQNDDEANAEPATMVGKFGYSPPEQMHLGQCYPCSDLYALGVTAIVLLTGKYPRDLIDQDCLEWNWKTFVYPSTPLADVLDRLIRQKPKERFQSANQVIEALTGAAPAPSPLAGETPAYGSPRVETTPVTRHSPPADSAEGLAAADTSQVYDQAFLELCRRELTRCIGPMASIVLEDAIDQHPQASAAELVEVIAAQISNGDQATAFISRIQIPDDQPISDLADTLSQNAAVSVGLDPDMEVDARATLTPDFISRCRQVLTRSIGPMASLLLEDALADHPNLDPQGLVDCLAAEIPDAKKADEFRQQLLETGMGQT
jgi:class 3 adenylate cyclase/tRNA A-37 threonylcarbamoyl transferase component Bud32